MTNDLRTAPRGQLAAAFFALDHRRTVAGLGRALRQRTATPGGHLARMAARGALLHLRDMLTAWARQRGIGVGPGPDPAERLVTEFRATLRAGDADDGELDALAGEVLAAIGESRAAPWPCR